MTAQPGELAVLMLACSDFEAMEIALACHMALGDPAHPFFILQNGRGTYDTERTLGVARRYERLYPGRITIIDRYPPDRPYRAIRRALDNELAGYPLICKVDDDTFPITAGWLDHLRETLFDAEAGPGEVACVAPLIANNNDGFPRVLGAMGLRAEFERDVSMPHMVGTGSSRRLMPQGEIAIGVNGTIWSQPHVARWLHERTTLDPDRLIAATHGGADVELPIAERFSINCILFRRELWARIGSGVGDDDEALLLAHCIRTGARIVCATGLPMVHLAYFTQREENRDLLAPIRALYQQRLALKHPIALREDRLLEIEARLKWRPPHLGLRRRLSALLRRLLR